jgi:FkbM family methyltransferase
VINLANGRRFMKSRLHAAGFDIVRYPIEGTYQRELQRVLEQQQIEVVIHVGAHRGDFARVLRERLNFTRTILSIEPATAPYEELSRRCARDARWSYVKGAASDARGSAALNLSSHEQFSSLHEPDVHAMEEEFGAAVSSEAQEHVDLLTADEIVGMPAFRRLDQSCSSQIPRATIARYSKVPRTLWHEPAQ